MKARPDREAAFSGTGGASRLTLSMAVGDYDQFRDLASGAVRADGISLVPMSMPVEEIFFRFVKNLEFDVSELSFGKYISLTASEQAQMVALPVFPSRVFRHSAIYIRKDSGLSSPADLHGKTIGIPEWAQTAGIYVRGILAEEYGLDLKSVRWVQAGVNQAGREEKVRLHLPSGMQYESRPDRSLNDMLVNGEIDAVISARPPLGFSAPEPVLRRLFDDPRSEELRFHKKTGIFPIMHVVALRKSIYETHPWAAMSLTKAFEQAKARSQERLLDVTAAAIPLPWAGAIAAEITADFGGDPFPYGVEANLPTLTAYCRYAHDQGVTARLVDVEELFPAEVRASFRV